MKTNILPLHRYLVMQIIISALMFAGNTIKLKMPKQFITFAVAGGALFGLIFHYVKTVVRIIKDFSVLKTKVQSVSGEITLEKSTDREIRCCEMNIQNAPINYTAMNSTVK